MDVSISLLVEVQSDLKRELNCMKTWTMFANEFKHRLEVKKTEVHLKGTTHG